MTAQRDCGAAILLLDSRAAWSRCLQDQSCSGGTISDCVSCGSCTCTDAGIRSRQSSESVSISMYSDVKRVQQAQCRGRQRRANMSTSMSAQRKPTASHYQLCVACCWFQVSCACGIAKTRMACACARVYPVSVNTTNEMMPD
eukprot:scaffold250351_cov31-Tisochrysis_lutea.AAC.1